MHIVGEGFLEVMRGVRAIPPSPSRALESKGKDDQGLRVTRDIPFDGEVVLDEVRPVDDC
ncbi:hypothetical protein EV363DRAFT_1392485 [Boletus edulis]|nr:hypothetical protein EV363DRAFT_1392485 [Boletus edulis]